MKNFLMILLVVSFIGCASIPRTKWTDKSMRVMVDPDSISEENYVQVQSSLVRSGKFTVVDRLSGYKAVEKEQERLHRNEQDRYEDKEKWAHWGKLYGVGAIVVAHAQCRTISYLWNNQASRLNCRQFISLIDANTGVVLLAVENENSGPASTGFTFLAPDWNETIVKLIEDYPKYFKTEKYGPTIVKYQQESEDHAKKQRELSSQKGN